MKFRVAKVAAWLEGVGDLDAYLRGTKDDSIRIPQAALFGARSGRRASQLMRLSGELFERVTEAHVRSSIPSVFATDHGEARTLGAMLDRLWAREELSPALFCQSVYNASGGFLSQTVGNREFTTTVAAGGATCAMGLAEALGLLAAGAPEVVLVVADEAASVDVQLAEGAFAAAGAAFLLRPDEGTAESLGCFRAPRRALEGELGIGAKPGHCPNPALWAVGWAASVMRRACGPVPVGHDELGLWAVDPVVEQGAVR